MRTLAIAVVLILLAAGGHYLYWRSGANAAAAGVEADIAYLNQRFAAARSGTTFASDAVETAGWPFRTGLVIVHPTLRQQIGTTRYLIETAQLDLAIEEGGYAVKVPAPFDAREETPGKPPARYRFVATPLPLLRLRTPDAQREASPAGNPLARMMAGAPAPATAAPDRIHQFRAEAAPTVRLSVRPDGQTKEALADFEVPPPFSAVWHPLPDSLSRPVDFFFSLLAEMAERATPPQAQ